MRFVALPGIRPSLAAPRPAGTGKRPPVRPGAAAGATGNLLSGPWRLLLTGLVLALLWTHTARAGGFSMASPALHGDKLNHQYACEAEDRSPPLQFAGIPAKSKSMAVLMTDQGSSRGDATLWIVYNLAPKTTLLAENQPHARALKGGGTQLKNVDGKFGYKGPCPVTGATKRFVIEAFALDTLLELPDNATRRDFLLAVEGHILARAKIGGRYRK